MLPGSGLLNSAEEAGSLANGIGYPVLLKVTWPDCVTCRSDHRSRLQRHDPAKRVNSTVMLRATQLLLSLDISPSSRGAR